MPVILNGCETDRHTFRYIEMLIVRATRRGIKVEVEIKNLPTFSSTKPTIEVKLIRGNDVVYQYFLTLNEVWIYLKGLTSFIQD